MKDKKTTSIHKKKTRYQRAEIAGRLSLKEAMAVTTPEPRAIASGGLPKKNDNG